MTDSKVFFDTTPVIYLLETNPAFIRQVASFISQAVQTETLFVTSVLTYTEYCVLPARANRLDLIQDFDRFLNQFDVRMLDITSSIAHTAYQLRAKYQFLRAMDALQLATALESHADVFLHQRPQAERRHGVTGGAGQ